MFQLSALEFADLKSQIAASGPGGNLSPADIAIFNAQYPKLAVRYNEAFHDRFLIIDDKDVYLIGASLKDLGRKCFAFMKLDSGEIPRITPYGRLRSRVSRRCR